MKKIMFFSLLAGAVLCYSNTYAQYSNDAITNPIFGKGTNVFSFGLGFGSGSNVSSFAGITESYEANSSIPTSSGLGLLFSYEHGCSRHWAYGISILHSSGSFSYSESYIAQYTTYPYGDFGTVTITQPYSSWNLLARLNYHILTFSKFDPYVGFGIGTGFISFPTATTSFSPSYLSRGSTSSYTVQSITPISDFLNETSGFTWVFAGGVRYYYTTRIGVWVELHYGDFPGDVVDFGVSYKL